tara:strand:+ start:1377 stop:1739 length:363 start_codon:yes stop_codon:yes gene_type:complete
MNQHKKIVLSLYRLNIISCRKLGYKLGTSYVSEPKSKSVKTFYKTNVKFLDEEDIKDLIYCTFDFRVLRKNPGEHIFYHIQKSFKQNKNIKGKMLLDYNLDLGFSISRFISDIAKNRRLY